MEKQTNYKNWVQDENGFHRYLRIKMEFAMKNPLPSLTPVQLRYPKVYYQSKELGTIPLRDEYEFNSLKAHFDSMVIDQAILNNQKEAVGYFIKFTIKDEQHLKDTFFPKDKKLVKEYGKPAKFSWIKIIYYGLVIILSLIAVIYAIKNQLSLPIIGFFILVFISTIYLLQDYLKELKKNGELERFKK